MKNLPLTLLLLVSLFSKMGIGQTCRLYGTVISFDEEPIVGATVMLIEKKDSLLKSYSISDKEGKFSLNNVDPGSYIFKVSFIEHSPFEKDITILEHSADINIDTVKLKSKMLNEVVVKAEFIPVQFKGDSIDFDPRAFEIQHHYVIEDLLRQLPGIEVEADGTILFQGDVVNQILVDGETFFNDDPKMASKNLTAESVEKIQVFNKKSDLSIFTGVNDDSEEVLTINLRLKKNYKKGYFGSILAATGLEYPISDPARYKVKGNLNFFRNKWRFSVLASSNNINETNFKLGDNNNLIGDIGNYSSTRNSLSGLNKSMGTGLNISYNPSKKTVVKSSFFLKEATTVSEKMLERETYFIDSVLYTTEANDQHNKTLDNMGNISVRHVVNSSQFFSLRTSYSWNINENTNETNLTNFDQNTNLASNFRTNLEGERTAFQINTNLNYRIKFSKKGRNTGFYLAHNISNNDHQSSLYYVSTLISSGTAVESITDQTQNTNRYGSHFSGNWVWTEPLNTKHTLQFNVVKSIKQENRIRSVFDYFENVQFLNQFLSADGDYKQDKSSIKIDHKFKHESLNTTIGTSYDYLILSGDKIFSKSRQFYYLLPYVTLRWKKSLKTTVKLNYKSSYRSPSLHQLQPILNNTNPSQLISGNPNLSPEILHEIKLNYKVYNRDKLSFLSFSLIGNLVNNNIINSQKVNSDYVTEITPENLGQEKTLNTNFQFGAPIQRIKLKFTVSNSIGISNGIVNLNGAQDIYTTTNFSPSIKLDNLNKEVLDFRTGLTYNHSINNYRKNKGFDNEYQNLKYFGTVTLKIRNRTYLNVNVSHTFFSGTLNTNQILLLNFHAGVNLMKSRNLQVYVTTKDLLNQNSNINQNYQQNIFEQSSIQTLGRYGMIGLKYKILQ